VVGPLPPPEFGVAKATRLMLDSPVLREQFRLIHLDTSDRRGVANIGLLDWRNVCLGFKHLARMAHLLWRERPAITLLTASQGKYGLLRDVLFALIASLLGSSVVTYLRGSGYADVRADEGLLAASALRCMLRRSSQVIVLGQRLVEMAHAVCPKAIVAIVPNGGPPAVPAKAVGARDPDRPVLLYLGRLGPPKGIEDALSATAIITTAVPSLEFVLCGDWETPTFRDRTMSLIRDLGLDRTVSLPGPTTGAEKEDLLTRAWVLILPSRSEGHPWVILEAMSAGIPVVATDTGAIAETITDGVDGFVVPVGDIVALAQRTTALLTDQNLWRRMAEASSRDYLARFTLQASHDALAAVLSQVLDNRG
jgi:hypothetical protein